MIGNRRRRVIALVGAIVVTAGSAGQIQQAAAAVGRPHPVRLVIDTDLFSDADDAGALATAFALENAGEAQVLAIGVDTRLDRPAVADASPRCAAAIAQFYGHPGVPIGASRPLHGTEVNPVDFIDPCAALAAADTRRPLGVVPMYRRVLARQPNHSVVVVSLGYLANLAALLASPADAISPMSGAELVAAKVSRLVVMAGAFPSGGGENNLVGNPGAAARVAENWPAQIVWDGYEVGDAIHTGQTISGTHPANSPVRVAYEAFAGPGNWIYSYDLTAVYDAVRPYDAALTMSAPGTNVVAPNGANQFSTDKHARQYYLRLDDAAGLDASIEALLDDVPG